MNINANFSGALKSAQSGIADSQTVATPDGNSAPAEQLVSQPETAKETNAQTQKQEEKQTPTDTAVGSKEDGEAKDYPSEEFTEEEIAKLKEWDEAEKEAQTNTQAEQPKQEEQKDATQESVEDVIKKLPEDMQKLLADAQKKQQHQQRKNPFSKHLEGIPKDDPIVPLSEEIAGRLEQQDNLTNEFKGDLIKIADALDKMSAAFWSREIEHQIQDAKRYYSARKIEFNEDEIRQLAMNGAIPPSNSMIKDHILRTRRDAIINAERRMGQQEQAKRQQDMANSSSPSGDGNASAVNRKKTYQDELKEVADALRQRHGIKEGPIERISANVSNLFGRRRTA